MKILTTFVAAAALCACGDNIKPGNGTADAKKTTGDGGSNGGFPAAPQLGTQIDRMGRPAINTALNHGFDPSAAAAGSAKDAYNADGSPGGWTQYAPTFTVGLGVIDSLDTSTVPGNGCGNQVLYNGMPAGGGSAVAASYGTLATILSDDELYLDATNGSCELAGTGSDGTTHDYGQNYLAVELAVVTGLPNVTCGGRYLKNDVMATSYSALAVGIGGFNTGDFYKPAFSDGATAHTDYTADFPFLGQPHQ